MKEQKKRLFLVYSVNTSTDDSVRIHLGKSLYFSTKEKAEDLIKKFKDVYCFLYEDQTSAERVYCIVLEEFELDSPYRYQLSTSVYSPDGLLLSDSMVPDDGPFYGRPENLIQHKIGDVIELPYGDQLIFGIVVGQPAGLNDQVNTYGFIASDDSYAILPHSSHEVDYAFAPMVFKPTRDVPDIIRKDLEQAFAQI